MSSVDFNNQILQFQDPLRGFAHSLTANREEAKDLLQDTMLKAITYKDKFVEKTNLKAWLYTIMKNTFINNYRRKARANTIIDETKELYFLNIPSAAGSLSPEHVYNLKEIETQVENLEPEYRKPFEMHNDGFKYKEIAEELELPIGTVKSRIFLARKKLMSNLTEFK
jgi:RNA polymerase sigma factor (sigma-70 family)